MPKESKACKGWRDACADITLDAFDKPIQVVCRFCEATFKIGSGTRVVDHLIGVWSDKKKAYGTKKCPGPDQDADKAVIDLYESLTSNWISYKEHVRNNAALKAADNRSKELARELRLKTADIRGPKGFAGLQQQHMEDAIADFFFQEGLALSKVESPAFKNMIRAAMEVMTTVACLVLNALRYCRRNTDTSFT